MGKRIAKSLAAAFVFWISPTDCNAVMSLQFREMFTTNGTYTSGNKGNFSSLTGTLYNRAGGPRISGSSAASADFHYSGANYGVATISNNPKLFFGAWFFCKTAETSGSNENYVMSWVGSLVELIIKDSNFYAGVYPSSVTVLPINPINQWVFIGVAISQVSGSNYDVRGYYKTVGGSLTQFASYSNISIGTSSHTQCRFGMFINSSPLINGRIGGCSIYTFQNSDFSDIAYPSDLLEPSTGLTWYVNPSTGSDNNDGTSAAGAWQSAAKVNIESANAGLFTSDTYASGDTLYFDTSGAPLDLTGATNELIIATRGLNVKAAPGSEWWVVKSDVTINNASFSLVPGLTKTYMAAATGQTNCVVWEDAKWLNHPNGASLASVTNSLETTPGSFYADGAYVYVHPFGDTNPTSDGKSYTRSIARGSNSRDALINLNAPNFNFQDCWAGWTALCQSSDGDGLGGYVVGTGSYSVNERIARCYLFYGAKHALGLVAAGTNSTILVDSVRAEQCTPYGSQSPFVSFMAQATALNNVHNYLNCTSSVPIGVIGSTNGGASPQSVILSHNSSSGLQFSSISLTNCYFPEGGIALGVATNVYAVGGTYGTFTVNSYNLEVKRSQVFAVNNAGTNNVLVQDCIIAPTVAYGNNSGFNVSSTMIIERCTVDTTGIPSTDASLRSVFMRSGAAVLTFRNNVFICKPGGQFTVFGNFTNTDTISSSGNVFRLGSSGYVAWNYNAGSGGADKTFSQWQGLGFDTSSTSADPALTTGYRPYAKTPCWITGSDLGPGYDFTGKYFQSRKTAGAHEYVTPIPQRLMFRR